MLGSLLTGIASAVISNTLGQPSWFAQMGLSGTDQRTTDIISAANGLFYAGGFFGTLFTYYFSEKWGRLMGFKVAAGWAVLGGVLQTASMNVPMVSCPQFQYSGELPRLMQCSISYHVSSLASRQAKQPQP